MRSGGITSTSLNYTGQCRDDTGLLFYNARYYDPQIGRFISADSVVPGNASGGTDGVALRPLTVDFHETGLLGGLNSEGARADKLDWGGPADPQGLNRYSYVRNNPMGATDPTGHCPACLAGIGWVLGAVGITVSAPVIAAIALVVSVTALVVFLSDDQNRVWLSAQVQAGINDTNSFVDNLTGRVAKATVDAESSGTANLVKKADVGFIDYVQKKYKLSDKQREELHDIIHGRNLSKKEIEEEAKALQDEGEQERRESNMTGTVQQDDVSIALRQLLGLPLEDAGRSGDMNWFSFGSKRQVIDKAGLHKTVGDFALHITCSWRLIRNSRIVVASKDKYYPREDNEQIDDFEWDVQGLNIQDEVLSHITKTLDIEFSVASVQVQLAGAFTIDFANGYTLEVFPDISLPAENWRLFQPYQNLPHLIR